MLPKAVTKLDASQPSFALQTALPGLAARYVAQADSHFSAAAEHCDTTMSNRGETKNAAAAPGGFAPQHRFPIVVWRRIFSALPLQEQDALRFECKKFSWALEPTAPCWVIVPAPGGEAKKTKPGDPGEREEQEEEEEDASSARDVQF